MIRTINDKRVEQLTPNFQIPPLVRLALAINANKSVQTAITIIGCITAGVGSIWVYQILTFAVLPAGVQLVMFLVTCLIFMICLALIVVERVITQRITTKGLPCHFIAIQSDE